MTYLFGLCDDLAATVTKVRYFSVTLFFFPILFMAYKKVKKAKMSKIIFVFLNIQTPNKHGAGIVHTTCMAKKFKAQIRRNLGY